jgi:hypothetical protein
VGATVDGHRPHVHLATESWQVGLGVVSALSQRLELEFAVDGLKHRVVTQQGRLIERQQSLGPSSERGSHVRFLPDPTIFEKAQLPIDAVLARSEALAWLSGFLHFEVNGRQFDCARVGWAAGSSPRERLPPQVRSLHGTRDDIDIDIAWTTDGARSRPTFARGSTNAPRHRVARTSKPSPPRCPARE